MLLIVLDIFLKYWLKVGADDLALLHIGPTCAPIIILLTGNFVSVEEYFAEQKPNFVVVRFLFKFKFFNLICSWNEFWDVKIGAQLCH